MKHRADNLPNTDPRTAELAERVAALEAYIDGRTAEVKPVEDEEGQVIREAFMQSKDNSIATFSTVYNPASGFTERTISYGPPDGTHLSFTSTDGRNEDYGKYLVFVDLGMRGDEEIMAEDIEEAAAKDSFVHYVEEIHGIVAAGKLHEEKRDYARHELPQQIDITPLQPEEQENFQQAVHVDPAVARIGSVMGPIVRMQADTGESWLASGVREREKRKYIVLYRPQENPAEPYQAHVVYTSLSQANWRLLPKLGSPSNPHWHYKTASEELITLPAVMQSALWQYSERATVTNDQKPGELFDAVARLGEEKFDTFLAGMEAEIEYLSEFDLDETKLPVASANEEQVISSFNTPLYGDVDVRIVRSRDGTLDYYTYTRRSDGMRWIGMIQAHDAKMLDSFLLDKAVIAPGFYASPQEYGTKNENGKRDYEDNTDRVLGNVAVKALNGRL